MARPLPDYAPLHPGYDPLASSTFAIKGPSVLLKRPHPDVSQMIDSYCAVAHRDFPIELVVRAGLMCRMDYWADLARVWLPALSPERRVTLADALRTVSSARWASQRTRQRANRELRRLPLR